MEFEVKYDVMRFEGSHRIVYESSEVCRVVASDFLQAEKFAEKDFHKKFWSDKARMLVKKVSRLRSLS